MNTNNSMTARDWFTLALRILGIWELITTLDTGVTVFNITAALVRMSRTDVDAYVTHGLMSFLVSAWLLKAAPSISKFFYPDSRVAPPPEIGPETTVPSGEQLANPRE